MITSISEEVYINQAKDRIKKELGWQKEYNVAITGFRPQKMPPYLDLMALQAAMKLHFAVCYHAGYRNFLCGLAQGTDIWAAEMIAELKQRYKDIGLYTFQPCADQAKGWDAFWQEKHQKILDTVVNENFVLRRTYTPSCMQERNQIMVQNATCLVAVYDHKQTGGTKSTIEYARKHPRNGYEMIIIDPRKYVDTRITMWPNSPWRST